VINTIGERCHALRKLADGSVGYELDGYAEICRKIEMTVAKPKAVDYIHASGHCDSKPRGWKAVV